MKNDPDPLAKRAPTGLRVDEHRHGAAAAPSMAIRISSVVVLAAPFGPSSANTLTLLDREADSAHSVDRAVALEQILDLDRGHRSHRMRTESKPTS